MQKTPKVILLLETSRQYGRGLLEGVIRWSKLHGPVSLISIPGDRERQSLPKIDLASGKVGMIGRLSVPGVTSLLRKQRVPMVIVEPVTTELVDLQKKLGIGELRINSPEVMRLAANYFLQKDYRSFAYCGTTRLWSAVRRDALEKIVREADCSYAVYEQRPGDLNAPDREKPRLAAWLHSLPSTTAVICGNDDRARFVLEVCQEEKIEVPNRLAVMGTDNDQLLCELTNPTLSSVELNLSEAGYEAMNYLFDLMNGTAKEIRQISIEPLWIVPRQSSDAMAHWDPIVAKALLFISRNYTYPISVTDLVRHTEISRRALEMRFRNVTGNSISEKIFQTRLERAKQLLLKTDHSVTNIAVLSGFGTLKVISQAFRKHLDCTPKQYRDKHARTVRLIAPHPSYSDRQPAPND